MTAAYCCIVGGAHFRKTVRNLMLADTRVFNYYYEIEICAIVLRQTMVDVWMLVGTAAAALGAAILIANSPWAVPKRPPYQLKLLENAVLTYLDGSNRVVTGKDLWRKKGAVIMAVRRVG